MDERHLRERLHRAVEHISPDEDEALGRILAGQRRHMRRVFLSRVGTIFVASSWRLRPPCSPAGPSLFRVWTGRSEIRPMSAKGSR